MLGASPAEPGRGQCLPSLGADLINHSLAPEATLAREIGASFTSMTFITAVYANYFAPPQVGIIGNDRRLELAPIAGRIALNAVARFPAQADYLAPKLRSAQDPSHYAVR